MTLDESVQMAAKLINEGVLQDDEIAEKTGLSVATVDEIRIQCIAEEDNQ